jgi:hypothetical protein
MNKELTEYIDKELGNLEKSMVAAPNRDYLEQFAKANHGNMDLLLMQMSMNAGYRMAMENVNAKIKEI